MANSMSIALTPVQTKWLEEQVSAGAFPSVEDAVRQAVEQLIEDQTATFETTWEPQSPEEIAEIKTLLDEGRASLEREGPVPWEKVRAKLDARIRRLSA